MTALPPTLLRIQPVPQWRHDDADCGSLLAPPAGGQGLPCPNLLRCSVVRDARGWQHTGRSNQKAPLVRRSDERRGGCRWAHCINAGTDLQWYRQLRRTRLVIALSPVKPSLSVDVPRADEARHQPLAATAASSDGRMSITRSRLLASNTDRTSSDRAQRTNLAS